MKLPTIVLSFAFIVSAFGDIRHLVITQATEEHVQIGFDSPIDLGPSIEKWCMEIVFPEPRAIAIHRNNEIQSEYSKQLRKVDLATGLEAKYFEATKDNSDLPVFFLSYGNMSKNAATPYWVYTITMLDDMPSPARTALIEALRSKPTSSKQFFEQLEKLTQGKK